MELRERLFEYREKYPRSNTIQDKVLLSDLMAFSIENALAETQNIRELAAIAILGEKPVCECGKETAYNRKAKESPLGTPYGGFNEFCSRKCMQSSKSIVEKRKATTLERFGETSWAKTDQAKEVSTQKWSDEKKEKFREELVKTYQAKHGVDFYSQTQEYLDKRNATVLAQTDGKYTNHFQDVEKVKSGMIERYGVDSWLKTDGGKEHLSTNNPMHNPDSVEKSRTTLLTRYGNYDQELLGILIERNSSDFKKYMDRVATENGYTLRGQIAEHLNINPRNLNSLFLKHGM